jgi:oligosaccharide repeat unit polymerase
MSAQSLSRNQVFYTALAALLCWVYYRPGGDASGRKGRRRLLQAGAAIVVLAGLLGYFQYTGSLLNKSAPTQLLVGTTIPEPLVEPTLYITGSPEALSVAIEDDLQPTYGEQGRSVWIVPRLVSLVDPNASVPDTVAAPVPIPYSFNTYTWVGDLWFDFGWAGIVVGGLFLGAVTVIIDRRARRIGSPLSSWFAAAWGTTLLASVIAFEVFWLQTVVWLFAGLLIFGSWPTRSYGRGRDHLRTPPPPLPRPPG